MNYKKTLLTLSKRISRTPNNFFWLLIFAWGFLLYFPSLKLSFSLIDDGLMVQSTHKFWEYLKNLDINSIKNLIFEPQFGRIRPAYWIMEFLLTSAAFYNPALSHMWRIVLLLITLILINKLLQEMKVREIFRILAVFIFLSDSLSFENYYRLGPTEPYLGIYFLFTTYIVFFASMQRLNLVMIFMLSLLGAFTKESFFLIAIAFFGIFLLSLKNNLLKIGKDVRIKSLFLSICLGIFGSIVLTIKSTYGKADLYASNYNFGWQQLATTLVSYIRQLLFYQPILIHLALIYLVFFVYKLIKSQGKRSIKIDNLYIIFLWLVCGLQLAVLLPWPFALGRYLIIVNLCLCLLYGLSIQRIFDASFFYMKQKFGFMKGRESIAEIFLMLILLTPFVVRNFFPIANFQLFQKTDSVLTQNLLNSLAKNIPQSENVYVNYKKGDANIEIFLETPWHLELFRNRGDIKFSYLDETNLCSDNERYIFDRRADRFIDQTAFNDNSVIKLIDSGSEIYKPLNYGGVRDSFLAGGKLPTWKNEYVFDWQIYKQSEKTCLDPKYIIK